MIGSMLGLAATIVLGDVLSQSPRVAGDLVIGEKPHAPIVKVARRERLGLAPPGIIEVVLYEQPVLRETGCVRQAWHASFFARPGEPDKTAALQYLYASNDVALSRANACSEGDLVRLNPNLDVSTALNALSRFDQFVSRASVDDISCRSSVTAWSCDDPVAMLRRFAREPKSFVGRKTDEIVLVIAGDISVTAAFRFDDLTHVNLKAEVPPPF